MTLAERIRQVREKKGMTQKEVASLMGISQQAYGQYESGNREPKPETLGRIAIALGSELNEITEDTDVITDENMHAYIHSFTRGKFEQCSMEYAAFYKVLEQEPYAAKLWNAFLQLNETGKAIAAERVQELTEIVKYQKKSFAQRSLSMPLAPDETEDDPFEHPEPVESKPED